VSWRAGWPIVAATAAGVGLLVAVGLAQFGWGEHGFRFVLRTTARLSLVLFLAAFVASALHRRFPGPRSRWLLVRRRYFGVSFAVSHFVHGLAILALVFAVPTFHVDAVTAVAGGGAYVWLAAMTATSFDRTAAWLGPRRWHRLHTVGAYWLWAVFFVTLAPQAAQRPAAAVPTAGLLAALVLRMATRRDRAG
jgi:hypothetical protein